MTWFLLPSSCSNGYGNYGAQFGGENFFAREVKLAALHLFVALNAAWNPRNRSLPHRRAPPWIRGLPMEHCTYDESGTAIRTKAPQVARYVATDPLEVWLRIGAKFIERREGERGCSQGGQRGAENSGQLVLAA